MPPKAKFTKDEIIQAALAVVRKKGMDALTARELGTFLGSSARPVFTVFQNMEEVQAEVKKAARKLYDTYVQEGLEKEIAFKGVGESYIRFAKQERRLFQLLFMCEQEAVPTVVDVLSRIDDNHEQILKTVQHDYGLDETEAWKLYRHLWVFTHGIATLCATGVYDYREQEIDESLREVCLGLLKQMKG